MNAKSLLRSLANATLYLVTCVLIGTGLLLELRLDEEDGAARILGMGQDDWGEIHFVVALGFAAMVVWHLVQNRTWVRMVVGRSKIAIVVLIAGVVIAASLLLWPSAAASASLGAQLRHILIDD